nr:hypothetical protein [Mycolicibacterium brisbanense]
MSTVNTVPSGNSVHVSSSLPSSLVVAAVPNAVPATVHVSSTGSQIADTLLVSPPHRTRPSARMQADTSPLIASKAGLGLFMDDHVLVNGSKISASGVSLPASEYSPPIANTRPSLSTPEAKNCLVLAILKGPAHAPVSY